MVESQLLYKLFEIICEYNTWEQLSQLRITIQNELRDSTNTTEPDKLMNKEQKLYAKT